MMTLHRIRVYILLCLWAVPAWSCKEGFLDQVPDDRLTEKDIFINSNNTESYLANIYAQIPDEFSQRFVTSGSGYGNSGPWTGGSDEAEYAPWSEVSNAINIGNWNSGSWWVSTFWQRYYQGIRNANYFMANADLCKVCEEQRKGIIAQYKAEARALRAMYYFFLMRMYGPVVLVGDEVYPADVVVGEIPFPRSPFDACVNYVVSELEAAGAQLSIVPSGGSQYGRITRSICDAFKQEVLLLAASPLFNGNTDYADLANEDGTQLISQSHDPAKWERAAKASKAFIDAYVPAYYDLYEVKDDNGNVKAFESCRDVMLASWNKEWIFGRPDNNVTMRQYDITPYHTGAASESRGGCGLGVTQVMVDAFFMANGQSPVLGYNDDGTPVVNALSGFQTSGTSMFKAPDDTQVRETFNQWTNREPRFYVNITYDGRPWLNPNTPGLITYTRNSGNSGASQSKWDFSPTGYVARKNMALGNRGTGGRALVLYRLANVYLNYVEALNESSPGHPDIVVYLNRIRERAGIPLYGSSSDLPIPADQAAMREAIRKERRVELAFENVRWFDTRRWKIAEQTDNGPFYGLTVRADPPAFYERQIFETRVFTKKHYLVPIPQNETLINLKITQNTGWAGD